MKDRSCIFCVSGKLGFETLQKIMNSFEVVAVLTSKSSGDIIDFARSRKIPCYAGNPRKGKGRNFLGDVAPQGANYLISVNYLFLVDNDLILFPRKAAINIHGSLLPKYRGRTPHVWAIINGETKAGLTAHHISLGCDEGDIVLQKIVEIKDDDTGQTLLDKLTMIYPASIIEAISRLEDPTFKATPQNEQKATYYGKRTPDDGEINFGWDKKRIKNWIRAQAAPYPGAFSFYRGEKIIINECSFVERDWSKETLNGTILSAHNNGIDIKVCDGVIHLNKIISKYKVPVGAILGRNN